MKYRIVRDNYSGFEVQFKPWWCPWWIQCNFPSANTHSTIERARHYAKEHREKRNAVESFDLP